ncbi:type 4a pilus biogenesis protein PilO [Pectinatus sottacetonis]|uniref:type 4a pilus biogenesis protein PilO n=1 Tax=Pectinatus sottacetonis TaxID=1002795 RepID=UPI0018C534C3|nr:type 4a pilus biogenesis protein PilO [Pectinatus sottacetonis]
MQRKDKQYLIITIIIFFIWSLSIYCLIYIPYRGHMEQLKSNFLKNEQQITALQNFAAQHDNMEDFQVRLQQQKQYWQDKLPDTANDTKFITEIQTAATKDNISLLSIEPLDTVNSSDPYSSHLIKIKIAADYFSLLLFLRDLNELPRYNIIKKMTVNKQTALLQTDLLLQIYFLQKDTPSTDNNIQ